MAYVSLRSDHSRALFFKRTISAQIHFVAAILVLVATACLLPRVVPFGFWDLCSVLVFGLSGFLVFGSSAGYHFLIDGFDVSDRLASFLQTIDHTAIFIFIAGSYTPFLLRVEEETWKIPLLCMVWGVAIVGALYTAFRRKLPQWAQHRIVRTSLYLLMGWIAVFRLREVSSHLSSHNFMYLVGGGVAYSLGAVVYATKWPRLIPGVFGFHELWHLFVVAGGALHFCLIFGLYS